MRTLRLAWTIYRTVAITGTSIGALAYGTGMVMSGDPAAFVVPVLPIIVAFCLVVSLPLTFLGVLVAMVLGWRCPSASRTLWGTFGAVVGAVCVLAALSSFRSDGVLSDVAGQMFWGTLFAAGTLSGARAAVAAQRCQGTAA